MEQFSICQSTYTLKTALTWKIDYFSVLQPMKEKDSKDVAMLRWFVLPCQADFWPERNDLKTIVGLRKGKKMFNY